MFPKNLLKNGTGRIASLAKGQPAAIRVSPLLTDAAGKDADEVLRLLETSSAGLTQAEAEERLEQHGPNEVAQEKQRGWLDAAAGHHAQPAGDPALAAGRGDVS